MTTVSPWQHLVIRMLEVPARNGVLDRPRLLVLGVLGVLQEPGGGGEGGGGGVGEHGAGGVGEDDDGGAPGVLPEDAGQLLVPVGLPGHLAVVAAQPLPRVHAPAR